MQPAHRKVLCSKSAWGRFFQRESLEHLRTETVEEGGTTHRWLPGTCFPWAERRGGWASLPPSSWWSRYCFPLLDQHWVRLVCQAIWFAERQSQPGVARWRELCWKWQSLATGEVVAGRLEPREKAGRKRKGPETWPMEISSGDVGRRDFCPGKRVKKPLMRISSWRA